MAVLPESLDKLDPNDAPGSLSKLENYIRYMGERMEFAMRNTTRNVSETGTTTAGALTVLIELTGAMSVMQSTMGLMQGELTATNTRLGELEESDRLAVEELTTSMEGVQLAVEGLTTRADDTQAAMTQLTARMQAIEDRFALMEQNMVPLQEQLTALTERVEALEQRTEG